MVSCTNMDTRSRTMVGETQYQRSIAWEVIPGENRVNQEGEKQL
jgi:hypothetical protein